jgi:hypothetical protein
MQVTTSFISPRPWRHICCLSLMLHLIKEANGTFYLSFHCMGDSYYHPLCLRHAYGPSYEFNIHILPLSLLLWALFIIFQSIIYSEKQLFQAQIPSSKFSWLQYVTDIFWYEWCSNSILDLHFGGTLFQYHPGHWLSCFLALFIFPMQNRNYCHLLNPELFATIDHLPTSITVVQLKQYEIIK